MIKPERELLLGKYRLLRSIGSGGFAKVYLGEHTYLKTKAAIKVLRSGPNLTAEESKRFLTEARTIAQLHHSHIIRILDFDVENGVPYLVMEYAPNGSLLARYPGKSVLEPLTILAYVKQVASALQFAHQHQVVHCDVKPENMLLGSDDKVLLSDFGIAVVLHSSLLTQDAVGTMYYMAPEQFRGKPVLASDQYALAVVVYRWLCGQMPFNGKNAIEMCHLHTDIPPRPLREINPRVSHAVEQVVLTALAKDPKRRFVSVAAFAQSLEQAVQSERLLLPSVVRSSSAPARPKTLVPLSAEPQLLLPSLSSLLPSTTSAEEQDELPQLSPSATYQSLEVPCPPKVLTSHPSPPNEPPIPPSLQATLLTPAGIPSPRPSHAPGDVPPSHAYPFIEHTSLTIAALASASGLPVPLPLPCLAEEEHPATELSRLIYRKHAGWVSAVVWSPDGKRIASGSWDATAQVWDANTGTTLLTYLGHAQAVKSVNWSPDGGYIASGSWDNTVQIWDAVTGDALPGKYHHKAQVESVAWSPNGRYIASAGHDGVVHVWQASNKRTLFTYHGHSGPIWSVAWSPDGKYIASASHDRTVQAWEALTGESVFIYSNHESQMATVTWSSDGQFLASGDYEGMVYIWAIADGNMFLQYHDGTGAVKAMSWSPDSMRLASAVKVVRVRNVTKSHPASPDFTYVGHTDWVNALSWSPDGQTIASASDDETIQLWNVG